MNRDGAPLLATKLRPPRRARGVMPRPRLDAYLDAIGQRRLTVVTAPPGFGKTTAALAWVDAFAGRGARVAWLSLGPEDDDPAHFMTYLEAAFGVSVPGLAQDGIGRIAASYSLPLEQRLSWLIDGLDTCDTEVFLFLDDFQTIARTEIHSAVSFLLRHAPAGMHLVLLSREDVPLDLAPWRARDELFELDGAALLFTGSETEQLVQRSELGQLGSNEVPTLQALTGGWIAALRATLATVRSQGSDGQYLQRLGGAPRPIASLFADLLEQLPPSLVRFLECICVSERQSAGLAEQLSGEGNGQAALETLERQQLFFSAQDEQGHWYVFHQLFREFLLRRLRERAPADYLALQRKAADWFAGQEMWAEAIHHALAAEDIAQALAWIERHAMLLVGDGDILTLLTWEKLLGAHLVERPLRLRLAFAWALGLAMACDRAVALLDGVEADLVRKTDGADEALRLECVALRAVLLGERGEYEQAQVLAEQCRGAQAVQPWVPNAILNVIAGGHLHACRWEALYAMPPPAGDPHARRSRDRTSLVYRLSILGLAEYRQGHLDEAERHLEQAMALGRGDGESSDVLLALPAPTLALVYYEKNQLALAEQLNAAHMDVNRRVGPIDGLSGCYRVASRVARLNGQSARARTLLDEAERIATARGWHRVTAAACLERTRYCLLDGRDTEAAACIHRLEALAADAAKPSLEYLDLSRDAVLARAWRDLADANHAAAARSLEPQLRAARASGKLLDQLRTGTALALAWLGSGREAEALRLFLDLCRRAAEVGAERSILDQPVAIDDLVARALSHARDNGAVAPVLTFLTRLAAGLAVTALPPPIETEALSPRERHILQLISQGQSNKEIARNLGIAAETVKSHVKKIFQKLGVQSRAQATARLTAA